MAPPQGVDRAPHRRLAVVFQGKNRPCLSAPAAARATAVIFKGRSSPRGRVSVNWSSGAGLDQSARLPPVGPAPVAVRFLRSLEPSWPSAGARCGPSPSGKFWFEDGAMLIATTTAGSGSAGSQLTTFARRDFHQWIGFGGGKADSPINGTVAPTHLAARINRCEVTRHRDPHLAARAQPRPWNHGIGPQCTIVNLVPAPIGSPHRGHRMGSRPPSTLLSSTTRRLGQSFTQPEAW